MTGDRPEPRSTTELMTMLCDDAAHLLEMTRMWEQHGTATIRRLTATLEAAQGRTCRGDPLIEAFRTHVTQLHRYAQSTYCATVAARQTLDDTLTVIRQARQQSEAHR